MDQKQLLVTALVAAYKAGQTIMQIYQDPQAIEVWQKSDRSPLTTADKAAHKVIDAHLAGCGLPLLSEEGRDIPWAERRSWKRFWLVDPLDGTKEFIKRNGEFTVNIALIEAQQPVLGVIYAPVRDAFFMATAGDGAFRMMPSAMSTFSQTDPGEDPQGILSQVMDNSQKLAPRPTDPKEIVIVGSRSHLSEDVERYVEKQRKSFPKVSFKAAGSSLKLCLVAQGAAHVYPRFGPTMEWDIAAGHIIAQEAGVRVLEYPSGKPLVYNKQNLLNPWFAVFSAAYAGTLFPEGCPAAP